MKFALAIVVIVLALGLYFFVARAKTRSDKVEPLWDDGESIHDFVARNLDPATGSFKQSAGDLPDESRHSRPGGLRWVAGGLDGAFGHHGAGGQGGQKGAEIASLIGEIARSGSPGAQRALYALLQTDSILDYLDSAIEQMGKQRIPVTPALREFARNLAMHSPDRAPVKFSISLLGIMRDPQDAPVIAMLGRHEEFTLFATVALANALSDPEPALFDLAQRVHGWGRIHAVERLADTKNRAIKRWLLRQGYDNSVMHEYLAYTCATAGELDVALAADAVDPDLLKAATEILRALLAGGPARDINDYAPAARVGADYLRHLSAAPLRPAYFITVDSLRDYLGNESWDPAAREKNGWTPEKRAAVRAAAEAYLDRREWMKIAREGLGSSDQVIFYESDVVARKLALDTWPIHWQRLQAEPLDSTRWFPVMAQANAERITAIVQLAESKLPLREIASGPADALGLGPEFRAHSALDTILQSLGPYSGSGKKLVLAGLRSPVVRNRNMAIRTLASWIPTHRDSEIVEALTRAAAEEPQTEVKARIERLLAGKPWELPAP